MSDMEYSETDNESINTDFSDNLENIPISDILDIKEPINSEEVIFDRSENKELENYNP